MNHLKGACVWLGRIGHCRGFGIQSPTDYRFVRYVINEHWPYHAYEQLPQEQDWLKRKLGRLYLRVANYRQPLEIIDKVGMAHYIQAGCRKARVVEQTDVVQMAVVPIECDFDRLLSRCNEHSVVIFQDIWRHKTLWRCIVHDPRACQTFDLYYCGIVLFDSRRAKNHYIVNF